MKLKINYKIGDMLSDNYNDKKIVLQKMNRFLNTQPLWETKTMLIDVVNLYQRKFCCSKSNCDFYIKCRDELQLFEGNDIEFVDGSCCEGGSLVISKNVYDNIRHNIEDIKRYMNVKSAKFIEVEGWCYRIDTSIRSYAIRSVSSDNRCVFSTIKDGMCLCALHSYALDNNKPVSDFKPFECSMFPMDFIEINKKVLITSVSNNGDTNGILRWGYEHNTHSCIVNQNEGIPLYEFCKDSIIEILGESKYKLIDNIYKTGRWKRTIKEKKK